MEHLEGQLDGADIVLEDALARPGKTDDSRRVDHTWSANRGDGARIDTDDHASPGAWTGAIDESRSCRSFVRFVLR
jgi:hypothetical protein